MWITKEGNYGHYSSTQLLMCSTLHYSSTQLLMCALLTPWATHRARSHAATPVFSSPGTFSCFTTFEQGVDRLTLAHVFAAKWMFYVTLINSAVSNTEEVKNWIRMQVILTCEQLSWAETIPSLIRESDCCLHLNAGTRGRNPAEEKLNAKPSDCRDTLAAVRGLTRATAAISYHTSRAVNEIISGNFHNIWYSENSPSQSNQGEGLLASRGCLQ